MHVDVADRGLFGLPVDDLVEGDGMELAVIDRDHGIPLVAVVVVEEVAHRLIAEVAGVFLVEGDGIGAAQDITDIDLDHGELVAAGGEAALDLEFDDLAEFDLGVEDIAEGIVLDDDAGDLFQFFGAEAFGHALGDDDDTVAVAHGAAFDHGGLDDIADVVEGDKARGLELFSDDGDGGPGRFGDAQGEVAGVAAHGDGDVPAVHGAGVFHQVFDQGGAEVAGGLVAEGGQIVGQR